MTNDKIEHSNNIDINKNNASSIDGKIDVIVKKLYDNNIHYLHKMASYETPDANVNFTLPENYFIMPDTMRIHTLCNALPPCSGLHNGRIILDYNGYFVGVTPTDCAKRFTVLKTIKKTTKKTPVRGQDRDALIVDLYNYAYTCDEKLRAKIGLNTQYSPKYVFFNKVELPSTDNEIVKRITKYYNDDIKGVDLRTNVPLAESYFILVGWLFSPIEREQRLVGCFECKTSGIGKTSFIKCLCDKVDVVFGGIAQSVGTANAFSFSPCFAQGPDIVNVDDPCKGTTDIMSYVGNVVSNKEAQVELKGENRYTLRNLETKVYVSTNVPIYIKNDTTNFMTTKLFVLKANDTLPDDGRSSKICEYIKGCDREIVEEFLSYCVQQYEKYGTEFIKSHMGIYIDKEAEKNLFEDVLDYKLVRDARIGKTTLIDCVREDMERDNNSHGAQSIEHNDITLKCWNMLCKHIQTQWGEIAKETVCSVPRKSKVYPVGSRPDKSRYKNYVITYPLQQMLLEHLDPTADDDTCEQSMYFDADDLF